MLYWLWSLLRQLKGYKDPLNISYVFSSKLAMTKSVSSPTAYKMSFNTKNTIFFKIMENKFFIPS